MARDWHAWYQHYDDPGSSLSRRLEVVREQLAAVLAGRAGPVRLLSLCAGDGRDTLPVLAQVAPDASATLVELDPGLADRARRSAADLGLASVKVVTGDAGDSATLLAAAPVDVLMLCGVFGNVPDGDVARTVRFLPRLLAPGAVVLWTRGARVDRDPSRVEGDAGEHVRRLFVDAGHEELAFLRPADAGFRVGVHRVDGRPEPRDVPTRLFEFVD